jgi:hypothetical protein
MHIYIPWGSPAPHLTSVSGYWIHVDNAYIDVYMHMSISIPRYMHIYIPWGSPAPHLTSVRAYWSYAATRPPTQPILSPLRSSADAALGSLYICRYVCMYVCMYAHSAHFEPFEVFWRRCSRITVHIYVCMYVCMCICMCVCMYVSQPILSPHTHIERERQKSYLTRPSLQTHAYPHTCTHRETENECVREKPHT